jgi:hypothetical protein
VFHNKVGDGKQVTEEDKTQSPKSASKHVESGDTSLNATVVEVRKKIRAVNIFKGLLDSEMILNLLHL